MFLKSLPKRLMSFFLLSSFVTNSLKFIYAQKISHQFINSFPLISLQFQKKHNPKLKNRNFESFQWNDINFNRRILKRNEEGKPEGNIEKRERKKEFQFQSQFKNCAQARFVLPNSPIPLKPMETWKPEYNKISLSPSKFHTRRRTYFPIHPRRYLVWTSTACLKILNFHTWSPKKKSVCIVYRCHSGKCVG